MRRPAVLLLLLALLASPLFATQPNPSAKQKELIDQIITLTKLDENVRFLLDRMLEGMEKQMESRAAEDKKDFARYRELVREKIDYRQWVLDVYEPLFAKYYTEQQLADLVTFYKSPTGQQMVKVLPKIESEAMESTGEKMKAKFIALGEQVQQERKARRPWEQTMADMRLVATAVEAWSTDNDESLYPAAMTWEELRKQLEPTYVKTLPQKDGWGNEYAYVVSEDRKHYRIVSAGADNAFEWDSRKIVVKPEGSPVKTSERLEDDIIYGDGSFVQIPKLAEKEQ